MTQMNLAMFSETAEYAGIPDAGLTAEILNRVVGMQSNRDIFSYISNKYGSESIKPAHIRKFTAIIQWFIISNYYDLFQLFCKKNSIYLFDDDLDFSKKDAATARMVFVAFLREEVGMRPYVNHLNVV